MIPAFIRGLERAMMQYHIDKSPTESGGLRQTASEIDAKMVAGSRINWEAYQAGRAFGVQLYRQFTGYVPLTQNH